ncbi:MAG: thioredoxin family protein [Lachnospiraceae bacterium]|nr:thioredoxin family protein [Lachnospiraceae bacterium]
MALFGFGKKKEEKKEQSCCCGGICTPEKMAEAEQEKAAGGIKVLGGGCAKCHELEANTKTALAELGIEEPVELITDFAVIATYGVMSTPALVVDNKVVSYGKVLKPAEVAELVKKVRA